MDREPRLSASVILVRDGDRGIETFLLRRHDRAHAFSSAHVFPGGTVRPDDRAAPPVDEASVEDLRARSDVPIAVDAVRTVFRCALRELFEESGVLLARNLPRDVATGPSLPWATRRQAVQQGALSFDELLGGLGIAADFTALTPFSHWITPEGLPARYDTWFFVARMPESQEATACDVETTDGRWLTAREALSRAEAGEVSLVYPTYVHLQRIAELETVASLQRLGQGKAIRCVLATWIGEGAARRPFLPEAVGDGW